MENPESFMEILDHRSREGWRRTKVQDTPQTCLTHHLTTHSFLARPC